MARNKSSEEMRMMNTSTKEAEPFFWFANLIDFMSAKINNRFKEGWVAYYFGKCSKKISRLFLSRIAYIERTISKRSLRIKGERRVEAERLVYEMKNTK